MAGSVQFPLATLLQALARKHKNKHRNVPKLKHRGLPITHKSNQDLISHTASRLLTCGLPTRRPATC